MEGDGIPYFPLQTSLDISIHALRVEGDTTNCTLTPTYCRFLSTPSGWRATLQRQLFRSERSSFLSTPSGWRATIPGQVSAAQAAAISIHALRVEGDHEPVHSYHERRISIHALRVEGDLYKL